MRASLQRGGWRVTALCSPPRDSGDDIELASCAQGACLPGRVSSCSCEFLADGKDLGLGKKPTGGGGWVSLGASSCLWGGKSCQ